MKPIKKLLSILFFMLAVATFMFLVASLFLGIFQVLSTWM